MSGAASRTGLPHTRTLAHTRISHQRADARSSAPPKLFPRAIVAPGRAALLGTPALPPAACSAAVAAAAPRRGEEAGAPRLGDAAFSGAGAAAALKPLLPGAARLGDGGGTGVEIAVRSDPTPLPAPPIRLCIPPLPAPPRDGDGGAAMRPPNTVLPFSHDPTSGTSDGGASTAPASCAPVRGETGTGTATALEWAPVTRGMGTDVRLRALPTDRASSPASGRATAGSGAVLGTTTDGATGPATAAGAAAAAAAVVLSPAAVGGATSAPSADGVAAAGPALDGTTPLPATAAGAAAAAAAASSLARSASPASMDARVAGLGSFTPSTLSPRVLRLRSRSRAQRGHRSAT